ncbi:AAA family ATPase [Hyalangium versicolor]|uniref:AAA family ATPase n=1 Tax=Hyalangium versicolor TaxID=2861190 RepID=UPI001CCECE00|nr:ATP-binding protein [Hyalangium versicolor]
MLTRLYVDNYKCLVNFDLRLEREHLLMGGNGSGKSTVLEVLSTLRLLLHRGGMVDEFLPASSLTRWQRRTRQTFEVEVTLDAQSQYRYRLEVEHDLQQGTSVVAGEELHLSGRPLYELTPQGAVQLHQEDEPGVVFLRSPSQPVLPMLSGSYERITRFHRWLERLFVVRIDPRRMMGRSEKEESVLEEDLSNFASWYRQLTQERLDAVVHLRGSLREIFAGFDSLVLKSSGEGIRTLRSLWKRSEGGTESQPPDEYSFEELSDGQRALIGLYALLHALEEGGGTLCIDEPDNFVALREIQPFLLALREQERTQTLVISHHPEIINLLAPGAGLQFERIAGGPVRVSPFKAPSGAAVTPAELVARGWEDGR